jgi:hypothetical protein
MEDRIFEFAGRHWTLGRCHQQVLLEPCLISRFPLLDNTTIITGDVFVAVDKWKNECSLGASQENDEYVATVVLPNAASAIT